MLTYFVAIFDECQIFLASSYDKMSRRLVCSNRSFSFIFTILIRGHRDTSSRSYQIANEFSLVIEIIFNNLLIKPIQVL